MGELDDILTSFDRPKPAAAPPEPTTGPTREHVDQAIRQAMTDYAEGWHDAMVGNATMGGAMRPPWGMLTADAKAKWTAPYLEKITEAANAPIRAAAEKAELEALRASEAADRAKLADLKKQLAARERALEVETMAEAGAQRRAKIDAEMARRGLEPSDPKRADIASKMRKKGQL
jgi:hypothetical protein